MEFADRPSRVYMVRHGQTALNAEKRFRGIMDIPLNEQGRHDARKAADRLANSGITAVYSSPLGRAREVAEAISIRSGLSAHEAEDGLTNLDYGYWHGLTKDECSEKYPDDWQHYRRAPEVAVCPGGEALNAAADRVIATLRRLGERHQGEAIAAVTHGVMVRLAALKANGAPSGDWELPLDTGSAMVFHVHGGEVEFSGDLENFKSSDSSSFSYRT